jgi:hypothetical protein
MTNTGATSPAASTRLAPGIVDGSATPVASGKLAAGGNLGGAFIPRSAE